MRQIIVYLDGPADVKPTIAKLAGAKAVIDNIIRVEGDIDNDPFLVLLAHDLTIADSLAVPSTTFRGSQR